MAGQGAKKRFEDNASRLWLIRMCMTGFVCLHLVVRFLIRRSSASWGTGVGFFLTLLVEGIAYSQLAAFARPQYDQDDDLIYGGADLKMGGMCGIYHDILYIVFGVQVCNYLEG